MKAWWAAIGGTGERGGKPDACAARLGPLPTRPRRLPSGADGNPVVAVDTDITVVIVASVVAPGTRAPARNEAAVPPAAVCCCKPISNDANRSVCACAFAVVVGGEKGGRGDKKGEVCTPLPP